MEVASRPAVLEPVAGILNRYSMLPDGSRAGVAVSGGADSVCLLDVLVRLAPARRWSLFVLHLNHGWRGAESDEDARFVAGLAARLGLPCLTGRAGAPSSGANLEQQGREARLRFFAEQKAALQLDRIATGHTLDDQAETVLYRALRGSGPGGLAGILPVTAEGLVRPLLGVSRNWVLEWNRAHGLEWREDASNADPRFRRNALRQILPELARQVNPAAPEALARLASIALDEEDDWRARTIAAAAVLWRDEGGNTPALAAPAAALAAHGPALARRLLRHALESVRGSLRSIDHAHVEQVLSLAAQSRGDGRIQLPGAWAERSCGWLRVAAGPPEPLAEITVEGPRMTALLRGWRPGDRFDGRPFRDRLRRRNVPRWRRVRWPVLASGPLLLWAEGFGCSAAGRESGWGDGISLSEIRSLSI